MRVLICSISRRTISLIGLGALAVGAILLAGCGGSASNPGETIQRIQATSVFLYSNVDYPLNIPVGNSDTVTLNLSLDKNILYVTPSAGHGQTPVGQPIPLPADVQNYREIDVQASAESAPGPLTWQLISPIQQTLLNPPTSASDRSLRDRYNSSLQFQWRVQAVASGQNTAKIALQITYVYTDGKQANGTAELTQSPIPIVAVQPSPASNSWLPNIKLPLTVTAGFAGLFGFIQFLWNLYQAGRDAHEAYRLARHAMGNTTKKKTAGV
jgi:hypothetical protein